MCKDKDGGTVNWNYTVVESCMTITDVDAEAAAVSTSVSVTMTTASHAYKLTVILAAEDSVS